MRKLIIFDFDGTIADTLNNGLRIYNKHAKEEGLQPIKDIKSIMQLSLNEFLQKIGIPKYKLPFIILKYQAKLNKDMDKVKYFSGMKGVLSTLKKKYTLGILSSNSDKNIRKFLQSKRLESYFDFVIGHPHLFGKWVELKRICKRKGMSPEKVIYIGDEVRDIVSAKKAKIRIIAVSWGYNTKERLQKEDPDWIVDKPRDILRIIG